MANIRIKSLTTKTIEDGSTFAHDLSSLDETGKVTASAIATYIATENETTGLESMTDATVPLRSSNGLVDSSISEDSSEVEISKDIKLSTCKSLTIGASEISSAANQLSVYNGIEEKTFYSPAYDYESASGSNTPCYQKAAAAEEILFTQALEDESASADFTYQIINDADALVTSFVLKVGTAATNVSFVVKDTDTDGEILTQHDFASLDAGEEAFDAVCPFFIKSGETLFIEVSLDTGTIVGHTVDTAVIGDQFVPYVKNYGYTTVETDLVDEDQYTDAIIKTMYETNSDTNAYTDDEKTKLGALPTNATLESDIADAVANKSHGGGYSLTSLDTVCTVEDTAYQVEFASATAFPSSNFTYSGTLYRFIYSGDGEDVAVNINLTCAADAASTIKYVLCNNGSAVTGIQRSKVFADGTSSFNLNMSGVVTLAENDYLEVFVYSSVALVTVSTEELQLTIG